jgi:hypothetical protein
MVFPAVFNLADLNGKNGFVINGINRDDMSGNSVSGAGDVNKDGYSDIIIGAPGASPNGNAHAGQSYVIFGNKAGFSPSFNLSSFNGKNGFAINGINAGDETGVSVSGAGDINADGIADIIIGAPVAYNNTGQSYVIFGNKAGFGSTFNLAGLNGINGFVINGINVGDNLGRSSSAGDVNGDGIADIIISAIEASPNGNHWSGQSYVIFGDESGFVASFNLSSLNGINGFVINGIKMGDNSGSSVSSAGDVNGDGISDIIIAAPNAPYNYDSGAGTGQSYVIFGSKNGFPKQFNLASLNGTNGFILNGINVGDHLGVPVRGAGDVNGDGIADIIIAAHVASPNGNHWSGQSYVIFGQKSSSFDSELSGELSTNIVEEIA